MAKENSYNNPRGRQAPNDRSAREGHGDESRVPTLKKGKFMSPATFADLSETATSSNKKSGQPGGVAPLS